MKSLSDYLANLAGKFKNSDDYWEHVGSLMEPSTLQHWGAAGTEAAIRMGLPSQAEAAVPQYGGYWRPQGGNALLGALGGQ